MEIHFNQIMPVPLREIEHQQQSIWGSEFTLQNAAPAGGQAEKVILNASSGKGKTTFTHIMAGIRSDFSGELKLNDQNMLEFTPEDWAIIRREQLSFVFQDLQLFPTLTVKENLALKNTLTDHKEEAELKAMLDELGIGNKWDQECGLLSMGQQQRVAIIRALTQPFEWLIMDEPFSHLDEENTQHALQLIDRETTQQGAGFILTTLGSDHQTSYDRTLNL
jgi:ABC-type lipoprotein export system ATPase subunit